MVGLSKGHPNYLHYTNITYTLSTCITNISYITTSSKYSYTLIITNTTSITYITNIIYYTIATYYHYHIPALLAIAI